jgi:hypothetical protein
MVVYRWNGERWYEDDRSLWRRALRWVCWVGGLDAHGLSAFKYGLEGLSPVSVLGHRVTWYGHWADIRTRWGILVVNWRDDHAYISRDGTPDRAHVWLRGAPRDVIHEARRGRGR